MLGPFTPTTSLHTTVSGRNVEDVSRDVQGWHDMQHSKCKFLRVISADVVTATPGAVTEHWIIEACNQQQFTYRVYIVRGNGSITDAVSNADGSPFKRG